MEDVTTKPTKAKTVKKVTVAKEVKAKKKAKPAMKMNKIVTVCITEKDHSKLLKAVKKLKTNKAVFVRDIILKAI